MLELCFYQMMQDIEGASEMRQRKNWQWVQLEVIFKVKLPSITSLTNTSPFAVFSEAEFKCAQESRKQSWQCVAYLWKKPCIVNATRFLQSMAFEAQPQKRRKILGRLGTVARVSDFVIGTVYIPTYWDAVTAGVTAMTAVLDGDEVQVVDVMRMVVFSMAGKPALQIWY